MEGIRSQWVLSGKTQVLRFWRPTRQFLLTIFSLWNWSHLTTWCLPMYIGLCRCELKIVFAWGSFLGSSSELLSQCLYFFFSCVRRVLIHFWAHCFEHVLMTVLYCAPVVRCASMSFQVTCWWWLNHFFYVWMTVLITVFWFICEWWFSYVLITIYIYIF